VPVPAAGSITVAPRDEKLRARVQDVREHVSAGRPLVDVRSPDEYNGLIVAPPGLTETAQRKGHIPGAASIPWGEAVAPDGTFKPADELRQLYAGKGIDGRDPVIAYCRIGERSSHSWFVLRHLLGFDEVRNYDGSWTEWGSIIAAPIENPSIRAAARTA
jgi:thiosulfate/3-mercaptopyruvate sulfurtransferase